MTWYSSRGGCTQEPRTRAGSIVAGTDSSDFHSYDFGHQNAQPVPGDYNGDDAAGTVNNLDLDSAYPQRNVLSEDTVTVGTLNGAMNAEVDIWWYELTLGLDWSKTLFGRLDLFALVGPTMQVLDWEMSHTTSWTIAGDNSPVTTTRANEDGTRWLAGAIGEIGVNLFLDANRRWFIEASGEYLYLEDVTLRAGGASVNIDPESWGGKLGLGMFL